MPTTAPLPPLSPLAQSLARLDKLSLCGPSLPPGQLDAIKRSPQFQAHLDGARRVKERGEHIACAIRAARAELAVHAGNKATKEAAR